MAAAEWQTGRRARIGSGSRWLSACRRANSDAARSQARAPAECLCRCGSGSSKLMRVRFIFLWIAVDLVPRVSTVAYKGEPACVGGRLPCHPGWLL